MDLLYTHAEKNIEIKKVDSYVLGAQDDDDEGRKSWVNLGEEGEELAVIDPEK